MTPELDPRWDWVEVTILGGPPAFIKGQCRHQELEPITDVAGDRVATLCKTCDTAWDLEGQPLARRRL